MALPAKQRFRKTEIDKTRVELSVTKEPLFVRYKHTSWPSEKELKVMGLSNHEDLVPTDTPVDDLAELFSSGQYILSDMDMNIYEAHIYVIDTENGYVGYMNVIKTNPAK